MYRRWLKRALDILIALVACPFVLLISIPVAIAIKLDDGGPVFYAGKRLGRDLREFRMYKFRSMHVNAPDIRREDGSTYNAADDSRMTRVGRLLRKSSIDELPQALNVLLGQMSCVGPRPSPLGNRHTYSEAYLAKFSVCPGVTGLAQAELRNSASLVERMEKDIYYAEHVSFFLDVRIIGMTVKTVFSSRNIYCNPSPQEALVEKESQ